MSANRSPRTLRRQMRAMRRSLSNVEQQRASHDLARNLMRAFPLWRSNRIAFYLANDGEIDPLPLLRNALLLGKSCYLPRLRPHHGQLQRNLLWFFRYEPGDELVTNRFGILEPLPSPERRIAPQALDLVLLPLVAFDDRGNRLGMGGGYYDQTFSFMRGQGGWHRPRLIGLAHDSQRVAQLPAEPWDLPLDGVATDQRLYSFTSHRNPNREES